MSANRDRSQKFRFLYQNLYQIYRTGVDEAKKPLPPAFMPKAHEAYQKAGLTSGVVMKAPEKAAPIKSEIPVFIPRNLTPPAAKPEAAPAPIPAAVPSSLKEESVTRQDQVGPMPIAIGLKAREERRRAQLEALREQLGELSQMQKRIRFMLKEIEELSVPEKK